MNASDAIDKQIAELGDWRGEMYAKIRKLIHEAYPEIGEDFKWGTGVFVHKGNVCAIGAFKDHMKINFFQGAVLPDPHALFNSGLDAKKSRSIDLRSGDDLNETAFKELVRAAVAHQK